MVNLTEAIRDKTLSTSFQLRLTSTISNSIETNITAPQ